MVFSSVVFLFFFLPFVLAIYFIVTEKFQNLTLLLASLLFYFWGEGRYVVIMLLYMVFNYYFGLLIEKYRVSDISSSKVKAKAVFILSLVFNLGFLCFFKYFNFIVGNINCLIHFSGYTINVPAIHMPIGISFFTFQALSYVIDVYRRDVKAQRNIVNFSMYKALFPQLIAGPIIRYRDVASQVDERKIDAEIFLSGMGRFITGLGKKVIIANSVASVADSIFKLPMGSLSFSVAWLGIICYTLQIYFDFSGYSDMAIGLGRMFGFTFLENFNYPYISRSVKEFWRRWHISLSNWFRDYLYIPLGGNRVGTARTYLNLIIVFTLCGLWHGANWTFVVWGLWHGLFLVLERTRAGRFVDSLHPVMRHIYTMLVVMTGWVFFRSENLADALLFIRAMFGMNVFTSPDFQGYFNSKLTFVLVMAFLGCTPSIKNIFSNIILYFKRNTDSRGVKYYTSCSVMIFYLLLVFLYCLVNLSTDTYNPFIYFRF